MNAQAQAQSHTLSLSSDLLTGAEWSAAHVQELFRVAADVKAHRIATSPPWPAAPWP